MHYAENECVIPIRLPCNELGALCLTTNVLCRTAEFGALLPKCVLIVYIWPEKGVYSSSWQKTPSTTSYLHFLVENSADGREAAVVLLLILDPSDAAGQVLLINVDKLFGVAERLDDEGGQPHRAGAVRAAERRERLVAVPVVELALVACRGERRSVSGQELSPE